MQSNLNMILLNSSEQMNYKIFSDDEIEKIFSSIMNSRSESSLKDNMKLLRNCTEYLTEEELMSYNDK